MHRGKYLEPFGQYIDIYFHLFVRKPAWAIRPDNKDSRGLAQVEVMEREMNRLAASGSRTTWTKLWPLEYQGTCALMTLSSGSPTD